MIVLDDPANPFFAHLFDPEDPERSLGSGARLLGAQIAVTNEPVSHDIEAILPWLVDPAIPQMLIVRENPYLRENPGHPLYKACFYRGAGRRRLHSYCRLPLLALFGHGAMSAMSPLCRAKADIKPTGRHFRF